MDIKITRGDTSLISFRIKTEDGSDFIVSDKDQLFFTAKLNYHTRDCVLQKTYGNGISYNNTTNEYELTLAQDDTSGLECRQYVYDIELISDRETPRLVNTLIKGNLIIDTEVTYKENEG